jgi:hypothetical protein
MSGMIMRGSDWMPLRGVDQRRLSEARLQAHYAVQWLARAARAYVPPQPDDEHARGLDAHALDAPSPYEMPAHAVSQGAAYGPAGLADALAELAAWFGNAQHSLASIQRQMIGRKLAASPLRCWPHHFDLATLTTLPARNPDATGYVGAGLSPGDEYYDEPYFYVSVYPEPDPAALPSLPMLGHWHLRDFMAAIATAHKIVASKNQQAETDDFLRAAVDGAIKVFS